MSFILYVAVLAVSITSVMIGLDWISSPPPPVPKSVQTVKAPAKPAASTAAKEAKAKEAKKKEAKEVVASAQDDSAKSEQAQPVATTGAASSPTVTNVETVKQPAASPETAGSVLTGTADNPQAVNNEQAAAPDGAPNIVTDESGANGTAAQANAPPPRCDVQACTQRYISFTASDCTYQPFDGPRRLCTVGKPPSQAGDTPAAVQTTDATQKPASPSCSYDVCAAAYRSFDPATCTYQPFEGPRRLCDK